MTNASAKPIFNIRILPLLGLTAWMIFNLAETVQYVLADYSQMPVMEYWRAGHFWPVSDGFQWSGHPTVLPELIFALDLSLTHGRMYLPIALSGLCYLGIWAILLWAAYSGKAMESQARAAALLLAGMIMAWRGCSSAIASPLELQWPLTQFMGCLMLAALTKAFQTDRLLYLLIAMAAAAIASLSSAGGMLLWLVLSAAAVCLRLPKLRILLLTLPVFILTPAYFIAFHRPSGPLGTNLRHPFQLLQFVFSYLSMPFGSFRSSAFAIELGALNLMLLSFCLIVAWRSGTLKSRLGIVLFGMYFFTLLNALFTAGLHMDLNNHVFAQAKSWSSITLPMVAWAMLAIALVWTADKTGVRTFPVISALVIACCCSWGFRHAGIWMESTRINASNGQVAATMLQNDVHDPAVLMTILPHDYGFNIEAALKSIKENRKSIYARGADKWIGQSMSNLPLPGASLQGKITRVYPVLGGVEVVGWADADAALTEDHAVLFVNRQNKIAGFGRRPAAGFPSALSAWDVPETNAFVGFIALPQPLNQYSVYVRTFHGKVVRPLDGYVSVPSFSAGDFSGGLLPGVRWQPNSGWTELEGSRPSNGTLPVGPIFTSKGAKEAGAFRPDPFPSPANHCLVLPILHGASSYGQSAEVQDAATGGIIAGIPMLNGRSAWERWRIPLPEVTQNVAVVATDEGTAGHQWLAIATPEPCL